MKFRHLLAVALLTGLAASTGASASVVLYSQPFNGDLQGFYSSQNDPIQWGRYAEVYDNFTLATDAQITSLSWLGILFNGVPSPIASFEVNFYEDLAGQPGSLLATETFIGDAGLTNNGDGTISHTVTLGSAFFAASGSTYWVSFVPTLDFPPQWGWGQSDIGDSISFQDYFGVRDPLAMDFAFELRGTAVPEPSSWALCALGLGSILAVRYRQRRNAG
jgi:hypothetical protein